ncbi:hypothetical protein RRG08_010404 [Elysia crispata]|uniref:Uncharacterized protein n=1 Tax=Elysia crispata TaxID=231223 RepID=A0AAE1EE51_9GAST|nr:hypothetical protein RRG08_010404 [Elysia crispata]
MNKKKITTIPDNRRLSTRVPEHRAANRARRHPLDVINSALRPPHTAAGYLRVPLGSGAGAPQGLTSPDGDNPGPCWISCSFGRQEGRRDDFFSLMSSRVGRLSRVSVTCIISPPPTRYKPGYRWWYTRPPLIFESVTAAALSSYHHSATASFPPTNNFYSVVQISGNATTKPRDGLRLKPSAF